MDQLALWAEGLAGTGWVYLVMYLFATVDGFFPPIPSESVVIALTAVSLSTGQPALGWLLLAAAAGAFTGDQIAYQIGSKVDIRSLRLFRSPTGRRALDRAERALAERGASYVIAARYIPVGRVAVNMTAGALHYDRRRFVAVDAVASIMWAVYSTAIGATAGALLGDNPWVAVVVGVCGGVALGFLVDRAMQRWAGRGGRGASGAATPVRTIDAAGPVSAARGDEQPAQPSEPEQGAPAASTPVV
ncbi:MAG: VTT domain-containing protein [Actinobacteria bacterium]|nr:VTT domain-containing protein [Actinomycetota bacterium]